MSRLLALCSTLMGVFLVFLIAVTRHASQPAEGDTTTVAHGVGAGRAPLDETVARSDLDRDGKLTEWDFWILAEGYKSDSATAGNGDADADGDVDAADVYFHLVNFNATDAFDLTAERILDTLDQIGYFDDYLRLQDEQSDRSAVD